MTIETTSKTSARRAYIARIVMECAEMIVERMNSYPDDHAERESLEFIGDCLDGDYLEVMGDCPTTAQEAERELLRLIERDKRTGSRHAPIYAERTETLRHPVAVEVEAAPTEAVFIVTADHRAPEYRLTNQPFSVGCRTGLGFERAYGEQPATYFADLDPFGCGKSRTTPEAAIRDLLSANGCTNIRINIAG